MEVHVSITVMHLSINILPLLPQAGKRGARPAD